MRILHTEASLGWGGQEIRILTEAAGLISRGHAVELASPGEARIFDEATRLGVPATALPIGRKRLRGLAALRRFVSSRPIDVINAHSSTDSWLSAIAWFLHNAASNSVQQVVLETRLRRVKARDVVKADEVTVRADDKEFRARVRLDTPREREYFRHGGILPYVIRRLLASS